MNWKKPGSIHIQGQQDQHFEIQILNLWMTWKMLGSDLSFTTENENEMGNSYKKMVHFKLLNILTF